MLQDQIAGVMRSSYAKRKSHSLFELSGWVFGLVGLIVSIASLFVSTPDLKTAVSASSLAILLFVAIGYIAVKESKGHDRYAQAGPHLHYAAFVVRGALESKDPAVIKAAVDSLISSCAEIFSVITGRTCFVYVKQLNVTNQAEITNIVADDIGNMGRQGVNQTLSSHIGRYDLKRADRYYSINAIMSGMCVRYYLSNNIFSDFKRKRYYHPVLFDPDNGQQIQVSGLRLGSNWPLEFRSTLVVPIRAPAEPDGFEYFGFLCVDCSSRGRFDHRLAPDLAGAYAELIYVLYRHSQSLGRASSANRATTKATRN